MHYKSPWKLKTNEGVLRYFNTLFDFIEKATSQGGNVLIHCLAGAHRAGTTGVAWLMYKQGLGVDEAIILAQSKRK